METTNIVNNIYKNKEYTNFTTLFENIIKTPNDDPNINYEFEIRLVDSNFHTPLDYFKEFLNYSKLNLESFTDVVVITHKSNIPIRNIIYRSYIDIENSSQPDFELSDAYSHETKETLMRVNPNNFNEYPVSPTIKYAIETKCKKFDLPIHNLQRRLRLTYKHAKLPFKFDFTIRYIPNEFVDNNTKIISMQNIDENLLNQIVDKIKHLYLNQSDVYNPNKKKGFNLMLDLEIEYTKTDMKKLYQHFLALIDEVISNTTKMNIDDKYKFNPIFQEIFNIYDITKSPQVSVLTNSIIQTTALNDYVWLEKTDGIRYLLIFYKKKIYSFSVATKLQEIDFKYKSEIEKLTIFDTELYTNDDNKKVFKIFDVVIVEEKNVTELNFIDRMSKFESIKNKFKIKYRNEDKCSKKIITPKKYYNLESWKQIIDFVNKLPENNLRSSLTNDRIDGIIVQKIKEPYNSKKPISYKLKPKRLNTIDFKLIWDKFEEKYYLFLIGKPLQLIYNLKSLPRFNKIYQEVFNYNLKKLEHNQQYYILFDSPYMNNLFYFKPRIEFNTDGYTTELINESKELIVKMLSNPKEYNEMIFEMSLAEDGWIPLRHRFDKQFPNSYKVGLSNAALLFSPPNYNLNVYFTRDKLKFDEHLIDTFHEANKAIRTFIFDKFINNNQENNSYLLKDYNSCVDLAGGRGGDLLHLFAAGCNNIFAIDADKEALVTYTQKASVIQNKTFNHVLSVLDKNLTARLTFNAIHGYLNSDNTPIKKDLYSRKEFRIGEIDLVVMNYAFHYLCNSYPAILELRNDVKKILNPDGIFILTFYDGEQIMNKIQNSDSKFTEFKISLYEPPLNPKIDGISKLLSNQSNEIASKLSKEQINNLIEVLDIDEESILFEEPTKVNKNKNYIVFSEDLGYYIIFKPYYKQTDKLLLSKYVKEIFENTYEKNVWANMPLPTISSTGYREEPLVLNKYIDILTEDFDIVEEIYPLQNQKLLEYMYKNKIDNYLNDYLINIKTILLKMK